MPSDRTIRWSAFGFAVLFGLVVVLGYIPGLNAPIHQHHAGADPGEHMLLENDRVTAPLVVRVDVERSDCPRSDDLVDVGLLVIARVDEVEGCRAAQTPALAREQNDVAAMLRGDSAADGTRKEALAMLTEARNGR